MRRVKRQTDCEIRPNATREKGDNMPMEAVYEFQATHRTGWLGKTLAPSALLLVLFVVVCTALAMDASLTSEQRIATFQQSGVFP
jgi:hypothetical protein